MSKRTNPSKKAKYQLELSSMSLVFWGVCAVFIMGWIFVLGVMIGRGFLPANTAIADLKAQVTKLQEMVARNKRADQKPQAKEDSIPNWDSMINWRARKKTRENPSRSCLLSLRRAKKRSNPLTRP